MCLGLPGRVTATTDVAGFLMGTVDFGSTTLTTAGYNDIFLLTRAP